MGEGHEMGIHEKMSIDITFMFLWWTFSKSIDRLIEYQIECEQRTEYTKSHFKCIKRAKNQSGYDIR